MTQSPLGGWGLTAVPHQCANTDAEPKKKGGKKENCLPTP